MLFFDGRGSADDPTVAVAVMESALSSAQAILAQLDSGQVSADTVPTLNEPPIAPDQSATEITDEDSGVTTVSPNGNTIDGGQGFVFKPESDHEKKLVILLPSQLANDVSDVLLKDEDGNIVERGRSSGYANGGREHFRFDRAGQDYPQNLTVEVRMADGSVRLYEIPNPAERYD